MNIWTFLRLGFESIRGSNWRFRLFIFGSPALLFLFLLLIFPPAALCVPLLWLLIYAFAVAVSALQMKQLVNIKLSPYLFRSVVNQDQISRLAGELAELGFAHVGFFKVEGRDIFVEGLTRPDLKVYAMIVSGGEDTDAYAEFSSFYVDGGSYCLSGGKTRSVLPRPANMINIHHPGRNCGELLNLLLRDRPGQGLLDTPPERFQEMTEQEIRRMGDYIFKRGRG